MDSTQGKWAIPCCTPTCLCSIGYIVGFSVPFWHGNYKSASYGLWQVCHNEKCFSWSDVAEYFRATRGMMSFGLIAIFVLIGGQALWTFSRTAKNQRRGQTIVAASALLAGLCSLISIIIFGAEFTRLNDSTQIGYGYWISVIVSIALLIHGTFCVLRLYQSRGDTPRANFLRTVLAAAEHDVGASSNRACAGQQPQQMYPGQQQGNPTQRQGYPMQQQQQEGYLPQHPPHQQLQPKSISHDGIEIQY